MKIIWTKVPGPMIVRGFEGDSVTPVGAPVSIALLAAVPRVLLPRPSPGSGGVSGTAPAGVIASAQRPPDVRTGFRLVMRNGVIGRKLAGAVSINAEITVTQCARTRYTHKT